MREFFIVLKFEIMNFTRNKGFIISTLVICLICAVGLSIPTIKDSFFSSNEIEEPPFSEQPDDTLIEDQDKFAYLDLSNAKIALETIRESFYGGQLVEVKTVKDLEDRIKSGEFAGGYILKEATKYEYVIINNEMMDFKSSYFESALARAYKISQLEKEGIDYREIEDLISPHIESETRPLGKDSAKNYMYTYILVFGLYFIIMMYGQLIATSVASEKSNRAMEVLVTSTKTIYLIFGKVIGGALAGILQFGLILLTAFISYTLNSKAWDGGLDFIFKIPIDVILTFSVFGILGYLLFAFIYGALGALVSRIEDISASATPITLLFIAVFMVSVIGMQNTEGIILKVASFIPFSSFMAMFVRVSMGSVSGFEVAISLGLLVVTTGLIGVFAAKIYRAGTLMYGNRVKLKDAIKILKSK